ncbi:DUF2681 domain-containing protein [Ignatzschineria larvae DSM 13226]|uniref:DUF2681 domain-containing protein n=1 Tax=Ignatzschineria larvae DSM 13226 TaxID=1111732 RepID=A0ABZ3BZ13_9GAMM|nr:DUF2681 domain-containing protein [Ignatzschineria larvae]
MDKLKNIILTIGGLILAFFYALLKSKDRKIEKHKDEAERYKSKAETQERIIESEKNARHVRDRINSASESDIDRMLDERKAFRD